MSAHDSISTACSFCGNRCIKGVLAEYPVDDVYEQLLLALSFSIAVPLQFLMIFLLSSKVQARMAFSSYLQRVQQRLLAESRANTIPAWPDKDNDQMELVIRFLRRAASNLQQDIKVVLPSRQLPLQDRRRILSHQLGEFIHSYNKVVISIYVLSFFFVNSENDLEEVLTFYTQKNKSATVKSVKKDGHELNALRDLGNCENSKSEFLPHSLAKSQFCHPETLSDPPAYTPALVVTQPPRAMWTAVSTGAHTMCSGTPSQALRRIQSFTSTTSSSGAAASFIPSAAHIYNQKLSRPTSLKYNSTGTLKELNSLSAQAQSNQQAFISALQKLADKQVARNYASSSHINLLTQHVSSLGFYLYGPLSAAPLAPSPRSPIYPKGLSLGVGSPSTSSPSSSSTSSASLDLFLLFFFVIAYSLVTGVNPQQLYQPTQESYQLQFAIQKLQQQRLQSRQFLDQSHCRHQVYKRFRFVFPQYFISTASSYWDHSGKLSYLCLYRIFPLSTTPSIVVQNTPTSREKLSCSPFQSSSEILFPNH
uniref:Uncharacterized protein n=1 Tax=Cyclopterus lumpus TaxID=8103 RepID=A0A8C3G3P9_CYCLU